MLASFLSKNIFMLILLSCLSLLRIINCIEYDLAKMIHDDYWNANPAPLPETPIDTLKPTSKEAYVYMHCSRQILDPTNSFLDALKLAVYRLQAINEHYDPNPKDIIVMFCSYTEQWQIDLIKSLGVIVIPVDVIIPKGIVTKKPEYIDTFTKLHVWRLTQWERILFLDIDTTVAVDFLTIWDEPASQIKTEPKDPKDAEYYPYLFAAVEDLGSRRKKCKDCYFNSGVFMIKPDMAYYKRLRENMEIDKYRYYPEQDSFNEVFSTSGPTPAARLPATYNRFVEMTDDDEPDTKIMHCKFWARNYENIIHYYNAWWEDLNHTFNNKPLNLTRVYEINELFLLNTTNKEAYVFLLNINDKKSEDYFMIFQALKMSIVKIKEYQKEAKIDRDIIVLVIESIPIWQLQELQDLGALVLREKRIKKGKASKSDDYLKIIMWKLIHWDRILYIGNDVFINNKNFINIWNEDSTQINTKPKQEYKQSWHNIPAQKMKRFYPYVFSAALDPKGEQINSNMFMFKPSIPHYDHLMSLFNEDSYTEDQNLWNIAYSQDSPIPSSTLDQSYDRILGSKDPSINDIKAVNGKIWTRLNETDPNPFAAKFWDSFNKYTTEIDSKKIFEADGLPANCEDGTGPTRCKTCHTDTDYIDHKNASYMLCPPGVPFGTMLDWFEFGTQCKSISKECISCIQNGECGSCEVGFFFSQQCVINPSDKSDIVGYCSTSSEGGVSYIAKGSICSPKLTPVKVARRVIICLGLIISIIIVLLFTRFAMRKLIRRLRRKNYAKMDDSINNSHRIEVASPSTANPFKVEDDV